jgi:NAD(P)-dependent dehydrogenase (short-subunit alcohol dehydrogenase family)
MHPAISVGNVAVITGAADGIGLAAAQRYAALGMQVCMADINAEKLAEAASGVEGALAIPTDVSELQQVENLRQKVLESFGKVDVLMNNAGIGLPTQGWTEIDNWNRVLRVNLRGVQASNQLKHGRSYSACSCFDQGLQWHRQMMRNGNFRNGIGQLNRDAGVIHLPPPGHAR